MDGQTDRQMDRQTGGREQLHRTLSNKCRASNKALSLTLKISEHSLVGFLIFHACIHFCSMNTQVEFH